jgi:cytochrome c oxidase assembly protein subunit 11
LRLHFSQGLFISTGIGPDVNTAASNQLLLKKLLLIAAGMFGFGFALVPFYNKICEVIGINSVLKADDLPANTQVDTARWLTVEFDSNIRESLPWSFRPLQTTTRIHPGELVRVQYEIRNHSDQAVTGQAIPSYGPQWAARYFKKLDCFCFTQQVLQARETKVLSVAFVISPDAPEELHTVTLSYTFFVVEGAQKQPGRAS